MKGKIQGYSAIHNWIRYKKGSPRYCEECKTTKAKRYEWANISGEYKRDLKDYRRLCVSCHRKEGFNRGEYWSWNKGKNIQTNTGRTHIKKGQRISVKTEFKKGQISWNKYLIPKVVCKICQKEFQPPDHQERKYCSQKCYWQSLRGKTPTYTFPKGNIPWNKET